MYDNLSQNRLVRIVLPIEEMLVPYWNFLLKFRFSDYDFSSIKIPDNLVLQKTRLEEILENNKGQLKQKETIYNNEENGHLLSEEIDSLKNSLASQVFECVLDCVKTLIFQDGNALLKAFGNNCLAIYVGDSLKLSVYGKSNVTLKDSVSKFLRLARPMNHFLSICLDDIDESIRCDLCKGFNESVYPINTNDSEDILSPIYPKELLVDSCLKVKTYYDKKVWVNKRLINESYNIILNDKYELLIKDDVENAKEQVVGILIGEYVLSVNSELERFLDKNLLYYWINFFHETYNRIIQKNSQQEGNISKLRSRFTNDFLIASKSERFSNVLSFLQHNLYLFNVPLEESERKYFYNARLFEHLEQFENCKFLVDNGNQDVNLAIYNKTKTEGDSYNLRHYISYDGKSLINQRGIDKSKPKNDEVSILKPEIAFYYLRLFYEDFFEEALKDIQKQCNLQFLVGQNVSKNGKSNEIDAIVYVKGKIWFIELKTNLSTDYILSYRDKCQQWLLSCPEIASYMRFAIFGFTGREELQAWQSNAYQKENCNSKSFMFSLNIDKEKELLCCTETSYEHLKKLLLEKVFAI